MTNRELRRAIQKHRDAGCWPGPSRNTLKAISRKHKWRMGRTWNIYAGYIPNDQSYRDRVNKFHTQIAILDEAADREFRTAWHSNAKEERVDMFEDPNKQWEAWIILDTMICDLMAEEMVRQKIVRDDQGRMT